MGSESRAQQITGQTLKLVTVGRRSGLPHIVRLRFVEVGGDFFVLTGSQRSDWLKNLERNADAKLRSDTSSMKVVAEVEKAGVSLVMDRFVKKYGRAVVDQWYGHRSVCIRLVPTGPLVATAAAKGEGDVSKTYASWKSTGRGYYGEVAAAFDSASEEYDVTIGRNFINTWIRRRSLDVLGKIIRPDDVLLEIGAGTGEEAVRIARGVAGIVATDISPLMVELLRKKAAARGMGDRITVVRASAAEIGAVKPNLPGGQARVVYSFNGALNCEPRIGEFVDELSTIVKPGGYFVCSIRNKLCLMEVLTYAALLRPDGMNKRKIQPMMVSVGGMDIPSTYYSTSEFSSKFKGEFRLRQLIGLPAMVPPAYLNDYYVRFRFAGQILESADRALGARFPFNRLGDQTLYVFQRKQ